MVKTVSKTKGGFNLDTEEMASAGLHFGHKTSKTHPKMAPYLFGVRNTIYIIDLEKTKEKFEEALKFIKEIVEEDKVLLLVGTKIQAKELVKNMAIECGLPYVYNRWLGGTFSNFGIIQKRVAYFKDLEVKKAAGELEKYTKKERLGLDKELKDLEIKFGGIKNLGKLPDAIFVCDMIEDELAIKEARMKGIKVIAICHTNTDPTLADYPIPASDDSVSSVKYILDKIKEVIIKNKSEALRNSVSK